MKQSALAGLFYRELEKTIQNQKINTPEKTAGLYRLLNLVFSEVTRKERLQFATLFARIAYVGRQFELDKRLQYYIHAFRKAASGSMNASKIEETYALGQKVAAESIAALFDEPIPPKLHALLPVQWPSPFIARSISGYQAQIRVLAVADDPENNQLLVRSEENPAETERVQYNISDRNEHFNPTIQAIREVFGFPINLQLIEVEIDDDGCYRPAAIVVEPDYLIDVTAIAECFREKKPEPLFYLLKKFLPFRTNKHLILGHVANFFLDELMSDPHQSFRTIFPKVFRLNPMAFTLLEDREIREIQQKAQKHFVNLRKIIIQEFPQHGIQADEAFLEPTFYDNVHGLQGRLDLLHKAGEIELQTQGGKKAKASIVELKSGKAFRANVYGLSANHFTQTLLYDLMVRTVFGKTSDPANYILYSGQDERQLRFAPRIKSQQFDALQVRNQLLALEWELTKLGADGELDERLFQRLNPARFPGLRGFALRDLELFTKVYQQLNDRERKYFIAFSGFIAREQKLAKMGVQGAKSINGQASLWLDSFMDKEEKFEILNHLTLAEDKAKAEEPLLTFKRTERTNPLANFRQGDIAVLYPNTDEDRAAPLSNQLFKCSIVAISETEASVRLRSRQFNDGLFQKYVYWNLEHDLIDSSFIGMYRGLFAFAQSPAEKRALLLTEQAPKAAPSLKIPSYPALTDEQQNILAKMLAAEDYFLLWGPPGTGKTSMMLRYAVAHLLEHTQENLLLLAYTNRAVDEICESIERIHPDMRRQYFRIGSRYSTGAHFQEQLLDAKIADIKSRKELKGVIEGHRIVVSTVASLAGKPEFLRLKSFQRVLIDEASQILEPLLAGLLAHLPRFILIGDHKQLPAVVIQDEETSAISDENLQAIGLSNLRNSLFERLYKRCLEENWDWAFAQLSHQGRMHQDVMAFPNKHFYGNSLKILPPAIPHHQKQIQKQLWPHQNKYTLRQRVLFLPTPPESALTQPKTNVFEARKIGELVLQFMELYRQADREFTTNSLGVITPYRAQIAQIRQELAERQIDLEKITIDTVERYQGGARDIILISLCTNSLSQLDSLVSHSDEGVDRKLNVALTRAREQLVILGNPDLLKYNPIYFELMKYGSSAIKV